MEHSNVATEKFRCKWPPLPGPLLQWRRGDSDRPFVSKPNCQGNRASDGNDVKALFTILFCIAIGLSQSAMTGGQVELNRARQSRSAACGCDCAQPNCCAPTPSPSPNSSRLPTPLARAESLKQAQPSRPPQPVVSFLPTASAGAKIASLTSVSSFRPDAVPLFLRNCICLV